MLTEGEDHVKSSWPI